MPDYTALMPAAAEQRCGRGNCPACCGTQKTSAGEAVLRRGRLPPVRAHHRIAGVLPDAHRDAHCWRSCAARDGCVVRAGRAGGVRRQRRGEGRVLLRERGRRAPCFRPMCRSTWRCRSLSRCARGCAGSEPDLLVCRCLPISWMSWHCRRTFRRCRGLDSSRARRSAILIRRTRRRFLRQARETLGAAASFLVGVDLRKDPADAAPRLRRRSRASRRRSTATCWCG